MTGMMILLWSTLNNKTVEFEVDGRVFQITGKKGMSGYWERFFREGKQPTRRSVNEQEINDWLAKTNSFLIYEIWRDAAEILTAQEMKRLVGEVRGDEK